MKTAFLLVFAGIAAVFYGLRLVLGMTSQFSNTITTALLTANQPFGTSTGNLTVRLGTNLTNPGSVAGWTDASFGGYAAITMAPTWANGFDSLLTQPTMTLLPPVGGFRWVANGTIVGAQTVNAIRVDYNGTNGNYTVGTANLDAPQTVVTSGDQINVGVIQELVMLPTPP